MARRINSDTVKPVVSEILFSLSFWGGVNVTPVFITFNFVRFIPVVLQYGIPLVNEIFQGIPLSDFGLCIEEGVKQATRQNIKAIGTRLTGMIIVQLIRCINITHPWVIITLRNYGHIGTRCVSITHPPKWLVVCT